MRLPKLKTTSALLVVDLADQLMSRRVLDRATLTRISKDLDDLYRAHNRGDNLEDVRVPETFLLSLWEIAADYKKMPNLGLELGQSINMYTKRFLTRRLSSCVSLKQALCIFYENVAMLNQAESCSMRQVKSGIKLSFCFNSMFNYPAIATERSMVAFVAWSEHFTSSKLNVQCARFSFDKPIYSELYVTIFGENVLFNANENAIELLDSELNKTIQGANPYLQKQIADGSENQPFQTLKESSTKAKVESLLSADIMTYCHLDAQLAMLRMSKGTLYRKLKQEGTSFSALVLKQRLAILSELQKVHTHNSNEESSQALGFKSVGAFYQFLKKHAPKK